MQTQTKVIVILSAFGLASLISLGQYVAYRVRVNTVCSLSAALDAGLTCGRLIEQGLPSFAEKSMRLRADAYDFIRRAEELGLHKK